MTSMNFRKASSYAAFGLIQLVVDFGFPDRLQHVGPNSLAKNLTLRIALPGERPDAYQGFDRRGTLRCGPAPLDPLTGFPFPVQSGPSRHSAASTHRESLRGRLILPGHPPLRFVSMGRRSDQAVRPVLHSQHISVHGKIRPAVRIFPGPPRLR